MSKDNCENIRRVKEKKNYHIFVVPFHTNIIHRWQDSNYLCNATALPDPKHFPTFTERERGKKAENFPHFYFIFSPSSTFQVVRHVFPCLGKDGVRERTGGRATAPTLQEGRQNH